MQVTQRTAAKIAKAEAVAAALINAGEAIKAKVKEATDALNRAYEAIREAHMDIVRGESDTTVWAIYCEAIEARGLPFDLHQVRAAKHQAAACLSLAMWAAIITLAALIF